MNEWTQPSKTTYRMVFIMSAAWTVGVSCAVIAPSSPGGLSAVALFFAVVLDVIVIAWMAHSLARTPISPSRPGVWEAMGYGFAAMMVMGLGIVWALLAQPSVQPHAVESALFMFIGLPPGMAAMSIAWRMRRTDPSRRAFRTSLGITLVAAAFFVFVAVGPGLGMPFSITHRDVVTLVSMSITLMALAGPSMYCAQAALVLPSPQRARPWVWITASAVMLLMAAAIYPLVYPHHGGTYPSVVVSLAGVLAGAGLSLAADIESDAARDE